MYRMPKYELHCMMMASIMCLALSQGCGSENGQGSRSVATRSEVRPLPIADGESDVPEISSLLHLGMSHDDAMDALGVQNPFQRAGFVGDFGGRGGVVASPKFPG